MLKRRNINAGDESPKPLSDSNPNATDKCNYDSIVENLASEDLAVQLKSVQTCRKILSREHNPPIDEFFNRGAVPRLVNLLRSPSERGDIIFEASWALTNIASGDTHHTRSLVEYGALRVLVDLLEHPEDQIVEQCIWALGNIAGDGAEMRDLVIKAGAIQSILTFVRGRAWNHKSKLVNTTWVLSNLCRNKNPPPNEATVSTLLPVLVKLMQHARELKSPEIAVDATWAITYLSDAANDLTDKLLATDGLLRMLVVQLQQKETNVITPTLRAVGNIVVGTDDQTDKVIQAGVLGPCHHLLTFPKETILKETCWMLSNITAGTVDQIQSVIDSNLIPSILNVLYQADFKSQKEACWAISNLISGGTPQQVAYLINVNAIPAVCSMLGVSDPKVVAIALESLKRILELGREYGKESDICIAIESCGGLDKLENLQDHQNDNIYRMAYSIIDTFFSPEEEDEAANGQQNQADSEIQFQEVDMNTQQFQF